MTPKNQTNEFEITSIGGDITYKEEVPIDPMRFELYTLNTIIG